LFSIIDKEEKKKKKSLSSLLKKEMEEEQNNFEFQSWCYKHLQVKLEIRKTNTILFK
jgi:hypothetical protein